MEKSREEFKKMVYDLMNGYLKLDLCTAPEKELIANEYAAGSKCEQLYAEVYAANRRVCQRLGVEEDRDVETIISNLLRIGEHLGMKMYDYGEYFSKKDFIAKVEDYESDEELYDDMYNFLKDAQTNFPGNVKKAYVDSIITFCKKIKDRLVKL